MGQGGQDDPGPNGSDTQQDRSRRESLGELYAERRGESQRREACAEAQEGGIERTRDDPSGGAQGSCAHRHGHWKQRKGPPIGWRVLWKQEQCHPGQPGQCWERNAQEQPNRGEQPRGQMRPLSTHRAQGEERRKAPDCGKEPLWHPWLSQQQQGADTGEHGVQALGQGGQGKSCRCENQRRESAGPEQKVPGAQAQTLAAPRQGRAEGDCQEKGQQLLRDHPRS